MSTEAGEEPQQERHLSEGAVRPPPSGHPSYHPHHDDESSSLPSSRDETSSCRPNQPSQWASGLRHREWWALLPQYILGVTRAGTQEQEDPLLHDEMHCVYEAFI